VFIVSTPVVSVVDADPIFVSINEKILHLRQVQSPLTPDFLGWQSA